MRELRILFILDFVLQLLLLLLFFSFIIFIFFLVPSSLSSSIHVGRALISAMSPVIFYQVNLSWICSGFNCQTFFSSSLLLLRFCLFRSGMRVCVCSKSLANFFFAKKKKSNEKKNRWFFTTKYLCIKPFTGYLLRIKMGQPITSDIMYIHFFFSFRYNNLTVTTKSIVGKLGNRSFSARVLCVCVCAFDRYRTHFFLLRKSIGLIHKVFSGFHWFFAVVVIVAAFLTMCDINF